MQAVGAPDAPAHLAGTIVRALRGVRLPDGRVADVPVADEGADIDAAGWLALPAAAEPHAHLDKALTAPRTEGSPAGPSMDTAPRAGNDLRAAIEQWHALVATIDAADIADRALTAVRRYVASGITAIRTHVDVPPVGDPLRGVNALVALRERLRGRVTLQVCLLPGPETPDDLVEQAVAAGADLVGGCPHIAPDPAAEITRLLDIAVRHDLPVDLHADEQTDLPPEGTPLDIVELAEQVLARGYRQPVTASHCVRLGTLPPERLDQVLDLVALAGLGIVTLPITNLYLQGRDATHLTPRGIAPAPAILDAGIPLAAGADNLRDPFNPAGRADPFETTSLLMTAAHLRPAAALAAVTTGARAVLGLPPADTDLVLVPDGDLGDVLAGGTEARIVIAGGRVLADTRVTRTLDLPVAAAAEKVG